MITAIILFVPFKDLLIFGTMYIIAIRYRHNVNVHARAMVATGIVFIEPGAGQVYRSRLSSMRKGQIVYCCYLQHLAEAEHTLK